MDGQEKLLDYTAALEKALWADLNCEESIQSETVATILDHAVVREDSNDKHIHLELYLRLGQTASAYYERDKLAFQTMFSKQYTTVYQTAGLLPKNV